MVVLERGRSKSTRQPEPLGAPARFMSNESFSSAPSHPPVSYDTATPPNPGRTALLLLGNFFWGVWLGGTLVVVPVIAINFGGDYHVDKNIAADMATAFFQAFGVIEGICAAGVLVFSILVSRKAGPGTRRLLLGISLLLALLTLCYLAFVVRGIAALNPEIDFNQRPISDQPGGKMHDILHQASTIMPDHQDAAAHRMGLGMEPIRPVSIRSGRIEPRQKYWSIRIRARGAILPPLDRQPTDSYHPAIRSIPCLPYHKGGSGA